MATQADVFKKLGAPPSQADVFKKLDAEKAKALEPSPYDTWGGTLTQIGKILGSGVEQAATGIAGLPAASADMYNAGLDMLPEGARPYAEGAARALNPTLALSQAARSAGAPTAPEMDQYLRDKGLQHTPENAYEDWAQYLTSAAVQGAVPVGQAATWANAGKGILTSLLPAAAGKGVGDFTGSGTAGLIASVLTGLGQHGVASIAKPEVDVSKQLGKDIGTTGPATLKEYNDLKVPAMTADVIPETSQSATATRNAVAHYPEAGRSLVESLLNRATSAAGRIKDHFNTATGTSDTADFHVGTIMREAEDIATPLYNDIRSSDLTVNVSKALKLITPYTKGASESPSLLQSTMDTLSKKLLKKLPGETGVSVPNNQAQAAFAAREYIEAQVKAHPELESYLRPIYKRLNGALTGPYPELIDADNAKAFAELRAKTVEAGRKAATSKAADDVSDAFEELGGHPRGDVLQQDYKIGYSDAMKGKVEKTSVKGKASTPLNATGQGEKLSTLYGPDMAQKRDFEITAADTKKKYAVAPDAKGDFIERVRHTPGYGFGAVTGLAGALGSSLMGNNTLAALSGAGALTSGAIGLTKILREPKLAKAWAKAAGIKDVDELKKFLLKGEEHGTYGRSAARAGLINAVSNYGRQ